MRKSRFDKIPDEAQRILLIEAFPERYGPWLVSSKEYDRILAVKRKYPHLFPWQAKYDSIPKEVHEAYHKDVLDESGWGKDFKIKNVSHGDGLLKSMVNTGAEKPKEPFDLRKAFNDLFEMEERREKEAEERRKKDEALWDRHYKKYGLKYKG